MSRQLSYTCFTWLQKQYNAKVAFRVHHSHITIALTIACVTKNTSLFLHHIKFHHFFLQLLHAIIFAWYAVGGNSLFVEVCINAKEGYVVGIISPLEQERLDRRWSRTQIEQRHGIPIPSLERWEKGRSRPGQAMRDLLCKIYGKNEEELGIARGGDIMTATVSIAKKEDPTMSEIVRRAVLGHVSSLFTGLVDRWPKSNYRYEELQGEISKVVAQQDTVAIVGEDHVSRRTALGGAVMGIALVPMQLTEGISLTAPDLARKTDTDTLLKHLAAGIAACWYLRRGKELSFTSSLIGEYIRVLTPLAYTRSEAHRKAAALLLSQSYRLKALLSRDLEGQANTYYDEAIKHALIAENETEQAIANRVKAASLWWSGKHDLALPYAEKAYALTTKDTPKIIRSFTASALALCQSTAGQDTQTNLARALDLFDATESVASMPYSESILTAVAAAIKQHSGHWSESVKLYEKSLVIPDISVAGSISQRINYAKTEVSRDDRDRDMDLCVQLLTEAIPVAVELDSKRYITEAKEAIGLLRVAWPREAKVKQLSELFG